MSQRAEGLKEVYRLHHQALLHESKKRSCECDRDNSSCESDRSSRSDHSLKSQRSNRQGEYVNSKKKPRVSKPHVPESKNHDFDGDQDCGNSDEDSSQQPLHRCCDPTLYRDMKVSCMSCSSCSSVWKRAETCLRKLDGSDHSRNSDFARKERSNYIDIRQCDRECECKTQDCKRYLSWADVMDARRNYWGDTKSRAPSRSERTRKLSDILRQAHLDFVRLHGVSSNDESRPMQQFSYVINNREVCEKAFLFILCLPKKDKKLRSLKKEVLQGYFKFKSLHSDVKSDEDSDTDDTKAVTANKDCPKFIHACGHIQLAARQVTGTSAFAGYDKTVYIPYPDITYFYYEYEFFCTQSKISRECRAGLSTFTLAWKKMKGDLNLSLSGRRGDHDTCAICANANELLRDCDVEGWSPEQRNIVMEFRRLHIYQQMRERIYLESNIQQTYQCDALGQPLNALILTDGMTVYRGDTPYDGFANKKDGATHITSRLIGAEVHCGSVHETFLYYTDDMVDGGGNIIVRVIQEAMLDLSKLLAVQHDKDGVPLCLPRKRMTFQFDNCNENKNYTVFTFASMLVERSIFEEVHINFLIVGHTHCSIDQYFSVIAHARTRQSFIASPLALEEVWRYAFNEDSEGRKNPRFIRKIEDVYDVKAAFKPLINTRISNISFPFCFKFSLLHGMSTCQYKQYSTHRVWLPPRPEIFEVNSRKEIAVKKKIPVASCDFAGGKQEFHKKIGFHHINLDMTMDDKACEIFDRAAEYTEIAHRLHRIEAKSLLEMQHSFENVGHGGEQTDTDISRTVADLLEKKGDKSAGVLLITKQQHDDDHNLTPKLLNYSDEHSYLDGMPDDCKDLGVELYAAAIIRQLQPIYTENGARLMKAIIDSTPEEDDIDVFAFMRRTLKFIQAHKELQKVAKQSSLVNPLGQDRPIVEDDNVKFSVDDLCVGIDGAADIAKTSRRVFLDIFEGRIRWNQTNGTMTVNCSSYLTMYAEIQTHTLDHQISNQEIVYYFERLFEPIVVATLRRSLRQKKWEVYELIPSECLTVGARAAIEDTNVRIKARMRLTFDLVKNVLKGSKTKYEEGEEILTRPGKGKSAPRTEEYKECAIVGCTSMAVLNSKCQVCNVCTCDEHSEHSLHNALSFEQEVPPPDISVSVTSSDKNRKKRKSKTPTTATPASVNVSATVDMLIEQNRAQAQQIEELKRYLAQRSSSS